MRQFSDVDAALDALDALTTEIGGNVDIVVTNEAAQLAEIQALKAQVAAGSPVTQEQLESLGAKTEARVSAMQAVSAHLKTVANPNNPTPPAPPINL